MSAKVTILTRRFEDTDEVDAGGKTQNGLEAMILTVAHRMAVGLIRVGSTNGRADNDDVLSGIDQSDGMQCRH